MTQRTVYAIASIVTTLTSKDICTALGPLLSDTFHSFQIHRRVAEPQWAAQGCQRCLLGFVLITEEPIHVIGERAAPYVNEPGVATLDMQFVEVPENVAMEFWAMLPLMPERVCLGMIALFPWDKSHGQDTAVNGPGGEA